MFDDLLGESKFKHNEDACDDCPGGVCDGNCDCTTPCQPEAMNDEYQDTLTSYLKNITLETQMALKYSFDFGIYMFYMPKYAYDVLPVADEDEALGVFKHQFSSKNSKFKDLIIRRSNGVGKTITYYELVELT